MSDTQILKDIGDYQFGFKDPETYVFKSRKGLDREIIEQISAMKGEPKWMLEFRLKAFEHFQKRPMPTWGGDLSELDLDNIYYYVKPAEDESKSWDDVPETIKNTFEKLGIPEAEQKFLAGVGAQYESEMVYHQIQEHLEEQGYQVRTGSVHRRFHQRFHYYPVLAPELECVRPARRQDRAGLGRELGCCCRF